MKTLFISALAAASIVSVASAATTVDLLADFETGSGHFYSRAGSSYGMSGANTITDSVIVAWVDGIGYTNQMLNSGIDGTYAQANNINGHIEESTVDESTVYTFSMINRSGAYGGSVSGFKVNLGSTNVGIADTSTVDSITLALTGITNSNTVELAGGILLTVKVYGEDGNTTYLTQTATIDMSSSTTATATLDLDGYTLASSDVYAAIYTTNGGGSTMTATIALTASVAETASVPEPATATLSLLALAGLAARRRRK